MSGYWRRPSFDSSRRLGQVYHTRIWNGHVMHIPATPTMRQRRLAGGGVVFHTLVHLLDAALWILGNPSPRRVSGANYRRLPRMARTGPLAPRAGMASAISKTSIRAWCISGMARP